MASEIEKQKKILAQVITAVNNEKINNESLLEENKKLANKILEQKKELEKVNQDIESGKVFLVEKQKDINSLIEKEKEANDDLSSLLSVIEERNSHLKKVEHTNK